MSLIFWKLVLTLATKRCFAFRRMPCVRRVGSEPCGCRAVRRRDYLFRLGRSKKIVQNHLSSSQLLVLDSEHATLLIVQPSSSW
jgi:hypothetical protein